MAEVFLARARSLGGSRSCSPSSDCSRRTTSTSRSYRCSPTGAPVGVAQPPEHRAGARLGRVWNTFYYRDGVRRRLRPVRPPPSRPGSRRVAAAAGDGALRDEPGDGRPRPTRTVDATGAASCSDSSTGTSARTTSHPARGPGEARRLRAGARFDLGAHEPCRRHPRKFSYMPKEQAPASHRPPHRPVRAGLYALRGVDRREALHLDDPAAATLPCSTAHPSSVGARAGESPRRSTTFTMQADEPRPPLRANASAEEMARDLRDALAKLSTLTGASGSRAGAIHLGAAPQVPERLPRSGPRDLPIHGGSLIGDALEQVAGALPAARTRSRCRFGPPTDENPAPLDDDDEGRPTSSGPSPTQPHRGAQKQDRGGATAARARAARGPATASARWRCRAPAP